MTHNWGTMEGTKVENNDQNVTKETTEKSKYERISGKVMVLVQTGLLILSYTAYGLVNNMVISSLPDFRKKLNCTVEDLSTAMAIGRLGTFAAIPFSFLADKYVHYSNIFIGSSLFFAASVNLVRPYWNSLVVYTLCEFLSDFSWATLETNAKSEIPRIWREKGQSPMLAMHFGYQVGAALGALTASYFVSKKLYPVLSDITFATNSTTSYLPLNSTLNNSLVNEIYDPDYKGHIEISFIIAFVFVSVVAVVFICLQCCKSNVEEVKETKKLSNWNDILMPSKWSDNGSSFGIKVFLFFVIYAICLAASAVSMGRFMTIYAVDSNLGFDPPEAARLYATATLMDGITTLFFAVVLTRFLSVKSILMIEVHGLVIASVGGLLLGTKYKIALYVFVSLFQMCKGPSYASIFSWVDHYIIPLRVLLTVVRLIKNTSTILLIKLIGYLYDHVDIHIIFYTAIGSTCVMCISSYLIYYVTYRLPFRYINVETESTKLLTHSKMGENKKQAE